MTCKHLGGRGLLLQGLARLGDEPRVLHRDHRLRREVLQQRDLLVGERPHFLAVDVESCRAASSSFRKRHDQQGARTRRARPWRAVADRRRYGSSSVTSVMCTNALAASKRSA